MVKKKLNFLRKLRIRGLRKHLERIYRILNTGYGESITVVLEIDKLIILHEDREIIFNFN